MTLLNCSTMGVRAVHGCRPRTRTWCRPTDVFPRGCGHGARFFCRFFGENVAARLAVRLYFGAARMPSPSGMRRRRSLRRRERCRQRRRMGGQTKKRSPFFPPHQSLRDSFPPRGSLYDSLSTGFPQQCNAFLWDIRRGGKDRELSIMPQAGFPCAAVLNLPIPRLMGVKSALCASARCAVRAL